jgi:hypothetical protein
MFRNMFCWATWRSPSDANSGCDREFVGRTGTASKWNFSRGAVAADFGEAVNYSVVQSE